MQVRADLVRLAGTDGVALRAASLKEACTLSSVTWEGDKWSALYFGGLGDKDFKQP